MVADIIAVDDHWLMHSLALKDSLPRAFRTTLTEHLDPAIRAAVGLPPRPVPEIALSTGEPPAPLRVVSKNRF